MRRVSGEITVLRGLDARQKGPRGEFRAAFSVSTVAVLRRVGCVQSQVLTRM